MSLTQLLIHYFGYGYCRQRGINQSCAHYTHVDVRPIQGLADKHQTINQSTWTVSHRDYRVPNLPTVRTVSVYGVLCVLPTDGSHGNDLSSAPYRGSVIRVGGG